MRSSEMPKIYNAHHVESGAFRVIGPRVDVDVLYRVNSTRITATAFVPESTTAGVVPKPMTAAE